MSDESLQDTMHDLAVTALRVKAERDEAVRLLTDALFYSEIGREGPFKSKVRAFLERLGAIGSADTMSQRDKMARHEGREDQDLTTRGTPLKPGS